MNIITREYYNFNKPLDNDLKGVSFLTGVDCNWRSLRIPKINRVYYLQFYSFLKEKERIDKDTGEIFKYKEIDIYYIGKFYDKKEAKSWCDYFQTVYTKHFPELFEYFIIIDSEEKEYYDWSKVKPWPDSVDSFSYMI